MKRYFKAAFIIGILVMLGKCGEENKTPVTASVPAAPQPARVVPGNTPSPAGIAPAPVRPTPPIGRTPSNFKNYTFYQADAFLAARGWNMTSKRTYAELPDSIKNQVREIGDYLYTHYKYGTRKSYNGLGEDTDNVFDCDDFAALMYRMGRKAGLEMYIIDLPGHWANAVRYGNTLYTIEPQGYDAKYSREAVSFGVNVISEYARNTTDIVMEK